MFDEEVAQEEAETSEPVSGRETLEKLASTGEYVFHGSDQIIDRLEPRQQTEFNPKTN